LSEKILIEQANAVNERQTNEAFKTSYTVFSKRTPAEDTFPLLFQGQTISFPVVFALETVPWLKRLVDGLSSWRPGSIHLGFVVDKVALGQGFLRVLQFSPANIIPPLLHMHLSPPHEVCDSSDQASGGIRGFTSDPALWLETE
jgi:hypothetical protein